MWIRSQRKNALVNINFFRVINDGNYCLICGATTDGCDYELGVYSSECKALMVLDEIQGKIECPYPSRVTPTFGTNCYHLSEKGKFYEMPQDEDVIEKYEINCFH